MRVVVGEGSCGIAAGALAVHRALEENGCEVGITGCIGMCYLEPIVDLYGDDGALAARLVKVGEADAPRIAQAAKSGDVTGLGDLLITGEDRSFLEKQTRIALRNCGIIDPESIESYRSVGGYEAISKILREGMTGESEQQPRHATSLSVKRPSAVVSPSDSPSSSFRALAIESAPLTWQAVPLHKRIRFLPTGLRRNCE